MALLRFAIVSCGSRCSCGSARATVRRCAGLSVLARNPCPVSPDYHFITAQNLRKHAMMDLETKGRAGRF
jgi:hypothetical protein